jgi:succinate dehydrogenase hydrophobic anchor subunit
MYEFIQNNYQGALLIGLLLVMILLVIHGLTGNRTILLGAIKQYGMIIMLAIGTPLILWLLKG